MAGHGIAQISCAQTGARSAGSLSPTSDLFTRCPRMRFKNGSSRRVSIRRASATTIQRLSNRCLMHRVATVDLNGDEKESPAAMTGRSFDRCVADQYLA